MSAVRIVTKDCIYEFSLSIVADAISKLSKADQFRIFELAKIANVTDITKEEDITEK